MNKLITFLTKYNARYEKEVLEQDLEWVKDRVGNLLGVERTREQDLEVSNGEANIKWIEDRIRKQDIIINN